MAIITGYNSNAKLEVGQTSQAARVELYNSSGLNIGASKTYVSYYATNFTAATTEALITLTPTKNFISGPTGTSFLIEPFKTLVLVGLSLSSKNAAAAGQGVIVRVRYSHGGTVPTPTATATSTIVVMAGTGTFIATTGAVNSDYIRIANTFPNTCAITSNGSTQIAISQIGTATAGNDVSIWGYEI